MVGVIPILSVCGIDLGPSCDITQLIELVAQTANGFISKVS